MTTPGPIPLTKNCLRCNIRCRVVAQRKPGADLFVKGDMKTGRYCANCLVVDFFKNFEYGGQPLMGDKSFFDATLPQPEFRKEIGDPDKRFDPECLRLPHVQQQFAAIIVAGQKQLGAELTPEEIDWDEVISNWHLPLPEKKRKKGK